MKYNKLIIVTTAVIFLAGCTKLEEKFNSETTSGSTGGGGGNATALLNGAYRSLNSPFQDQARLWGAVEQSSDEGWVLQEEVTGMIMVYGGFIIIIAGLLTINF